MTNVPVTDADREAAHEAFFSYTPVADIAQAIARARAALVQRYVPEWPGRKLSVQHR